MKCSQCKKQVTEKECSYTGLHIVGDCWGRVYYENGREYLGSFKPVSMQQRKPIK